MWIKKLFEYDEGTSSQVALPVTAVTLLIVAVALSSVLATPPSFEQSKSEDYDVENVVSEISQKLTDSVGYSAKNGSEWDSENVEDIGLKADEEEIRKNEKDDESDSTSTAVAPPNFNYPPVARDDGPYDVSVGDAIDIPVLNNDYDEEDEQKDLTIDSTSSLSAGSATISNVNDGISYIEYTAPPSAQTLSFDYTIKDSGDSNGNNKKTDTATVRITVTNGGIPPQIIDSGWTVPYSEYDPDVDKIYFTLILNITVYEPNSDDVDYSYDWGDGTEDTGTKTHTTNQFNISEQHTYNATQEQITGDSNGLTKEEETEIMQRYGFTQEQVDNIVYAIEVNVSDDDGSNSEWLFICYDPDNPDDPDLPDSATGLVIDPIPPKTDLPPDWSPPDPPDDGGSETGTGTSDGSLDGLDGDSWYSGDDQSGDLIR
ncbi:MAG: hypothetical protein V5A64_03475 [Candidatus Thermoplasmatota archaeon]